MPRQKKGRVHEEQARRIETKTRFELGFERLKKEHPGVDYVVIQPNSSDGVLFLHNVMDFESRQAILNYGYYSTAAELRSKFKYYKKIFERHKIGKIINH